MPGRQILWKPGPPGGVDGAHTRKSVRDSEPAPGDQPSYFADRKRIKAQVIADLGVALEVGAMMAVLSPERHGLAQEMVWFETVSTHHGKGTKRRK